MKNKGYTLTELIIIIVVISLLITATYMSVSRVVARQKKKAFQESLNGIIESAEIYAANCKYSFTYEENKVWYEDDAWHIDLTSGLIEMNKDEQIISGEVYIDSLKTVHIKNVYNGKYCGVSGTTGDYEIKDGEC